MSVLINAVLGIPLLVAGLFKRRGTAILAGATLCAFAVIEIAALAYMWSRRATPPEIGLHSVILVPLGIALAIRGARALR